MRLEGRKGILFGRPWARQYRVALLGLIGLNAFAFVLQVFLENSDAGFTREFLGLSNHGVHDAYSWQFVTAAFLHNGAWQFLANMLALYFLGRDLESILGQRHFVYLYLSGVLAGEFLHLFSMPAQTVLFAASGGAAALLIADATILPELELISVSLFGVPIRIKAKHLGYATFITAIVSIFAYRNGVVGCTGYAGGCMAGWFYAHLLGFGRTSWIQRHLQHRRAAAERFRQLSPEQLISEEVDPLLEKISRSGFASLSRWERRRLVRARERILEQTL